MTAVKFTDADYSAQNHLVSDGDISHCTKAELERFAVMFSRPRAFEHFGASSFPQICETVRALILVRMSEEQNVDARREGRLALIVAGIALSASVIQAAVSVWQLADSSPVFVQANGPLPVQAAEAVPVYPASSATGQKAPAPSAPKKQIPN